MKTLVPWHEPDIRRPRVWIWRTRTEHWKVLWSRQKTMRGGWGHLWPITVN